MKVKTIAELEKELEELRKSNYNSWMTYGSELCAGDMIGQEKYLEEQIKKLKTEEKLKTAKLTKEEIYNIVTEKVNPVINSLAEHRDGLSPIEEYGYNIWYVKAIRIICTSVFEETYSLCNENKS